MSAADKPVRGANIFDVARLAGVSHQTVSRVLNDVPGVRPATRLRVEQAITQLRYSPSPAARALVTRRTRMIGLIAPSTADYGPSSIALHFNEAARDARYGVVTITTVDASHDAVRTAIESLLSQRVEAVVVVVADVAVIEAIRSLDVGVPVVAVTASQRPAHLITSIDQYRGARLAVRHLIDLGHRHIAHISGPASAPDSIERLRGWRDELASARLVAREPGHGDWSARSGAAFGEQLAQDGDTTAVFASNDQMALGLMSALLANGRRVPAQVSVVGFDDVPEAAYFSPALTTVAQDFAALGALTMQRVLMAVEDSDSPGESLPLPTRLIVRESTAPPSGSAGP